MAKSHLLGVKELEHALATLEKVEARKVARSALSKSLRILTKAIKGDIPPNLKDLKKTIGQRMDKAKGGPDAGKHRAKAGVGVGKKSKRQAKVKDRTGRPGVGIAKDNAHWFVLGTSSRTTKSGKSTGGMPAQLPHLVRIAAAKVKPEVMRTIEVSFAAMVRLAGKKRIPKKT